ncbi:MAG: DUF2225 domain-containing protein [Candidatus Ozemobacteraceae bacterium]
MTYTLNSIAITQKDVDLLRKTRSLGPVAVSGEATLTRLIDQPFICPVCAATFRERIVETVSNQGQDSDFFPHYQGEDPLPYFLVQCPSCLYCAYPDDFTMGDVVSQTAAVAGKAKSGVGTEHPPKIKQVKDVLDQPLARKLPPQARRYYLAGKMYELQKRNPYHIGNLYLRGSWCCRKATDRRGEIELQQLAVKFLRQAVEHSTLVNPENLPIVTYLVGELYRRLEDKALAREWFSTVEEAVFDQEQQWILELTKKQAELNEHFIN